MSRRLTYCFLIIALMMCLPVRAQLQGAKWYFGQNAGLDFLTSPPTVLTGALVTQEGCASISDASGNLLFYTDGITVYNALSAIMTNGTGLTGNPSSTQSAVIVKQPGNNNIYYIFTNGIGPINYSVVDMNLSGGLGAVTTKNTLLNTGSSEKLTSVRHCNGTDIWVITHDLNNANFRVYLVTAAGVNPTPIMSTTGSSHTGAIGYLKASPNGQKLGAGIYGTNKFELYDFDPGTGIVSNALTLASLASPYGCEFSPDGTKFYGTQEGAFYVLHQWDLCAGSNSAIVASHYTIATTNGVILYDLQSANDGKIYVCRYLQQNLAIINNPNVYGSGCNFVNIGISLTPNVSRLGLPNFITSFFKAPAAPYTYSINTALYGCNTVSFTAPPLNNGSPGGCSSAGYSLTSLLWNFGDPGSGASNTTTVQNPVHTYSTLGTYTPQLILYYSCGGGIDTLKQVITLNQPCISIASQSISCASLGSATVTTIGGSGPYAYTWTPTGYTGSVVTGLSPGSYTVKALDLGTNLSYTATATFTSPVPFTGLLSNTSSLSCNGVNTGTASIALGGGTGSQKYYWTDGVTTQTTPIAVGLGAGIHTVTVIDAITSCSLTQFFMITQPPALTVAIVASSPTTCVNTPITFTASATGGSGSGYTYTWTDGPASNIYSKSQATAASYIYTVSARDGNLCAGSQTVQAIYIATPPLIVPSMTICPLETATITAFGANSYVWSDGSTGPVLIVTPNANTTFTVTGSYAGCSGSITTSVILKSVPVPTLSSNSPVCNGQNLLPTAIGGSFYNWSGPLGFSSAIQNPTITAAAPGNSGVYTATVTAANNCTASASINMTVYPTATLTASGSTVCINQTLSLTVNSGAATTFSWSGPNSFGTTVQNPQFTNAGLSLSGVYHLTVTSAQGCSNTAIVNASVVAPPVPVISANYTALCEGSQLYLAGGGGTGYSWSGPNAFASILQNTGVNPVTLAAAGIYTLNITYGPCSASTTQSITVYPIPIPNISIAPTCENAPLVLNSTGGPNPQSQYTFAWSGPNGFVSSQQNPVIDPANQTHSGNYIVVVTDANNCSSLLGASVTVLANPTIAVSGAVVCFAQPAILSASGAYSYNWSSPSGFSANSATVTVPAALSAQPEPYQVIGVAVNGCTAVATALLETIPLPVPVISVTPRACQYTEVNLQASGGITYNWKGPLNLNSSQQNFSFIASNPSYDGTYTLTVSNTAGCTSYTTANIIIDPAPKADLLRENSENCVPFCARFRLVPKSGTLPIVGSQWQTQNLSFTSDTFQVCMSQAGLQKISGTFTNSIGCANTFTFELKADPVPVADFEFTPLNPIENTDEVTFNNTSTGADLSSWNWYFINNKGYRTSTRHTSYTFDQAGTYPVSMVVKNRWGCADTVTKTITVEPDFILFVPNAFTPNDDNVNDVFQPKGTGVVKYSLLIFDRWGELVFETTDFNKAWDGTLKGKACQTGVYVWKISASNATGKVSLLNGQVTLYR